MVDDRAPTSAGHRITFRHVRELSWETYAVHCHQTRIGFVTRLPEGTWLAYLPIGISSSGWSSREAAAEALHMVAATVTVPATASAMRTPERVSPGNRRPR